MARVPFGRRYADDASGHHRLHSRRPLSRGVTLAIAVGAVLLMAWSGAATLFVLFRDDALKLLADRQTAMVRAHDREVGALMTELERLKSVKLLDQERVERTLADLIRRQVTLEQRQSTLATLAPTTELSEPETTATIAPAVPAKPSPLSGIVPRPDRRSGILPARASFEARLAALGEILGRLDATQTRALDRLEHDYGGRVLRMRAVLAELGFAAPQPAHPSRPTEAVGGPFLPLFRSDDPFGRQVTRVRLAARETETLVQAFASVPVRWPLLGDGEVTSGYGMRVDPFLRQLALHTGVDFRAEAGDPVRVTASGKVTQAGYQGGYGLMVEIDHGNGLVTRYAHLSAVQIAEGTMVTLGTVIGRVGTTGRSTGPHLHYEVRVNGEAIDPARFLKAGARLGDGF